MDAQDIGFLRPSLPDLMARAADELNLAVPGAGAHLRWSNLGVLAAVVAGAAHELHGHLEAIAGAVLPDRATGLLLDRHASWRGISRLPATAASGEVKVVGAEPSSLIPAGSRYVSSAKLLYEVLAPGGLVDAGGEAVVSLEALEPGSQANLPTGATLTLVAPLAGIPAAASVLGGGLAGGTGQEDDEALRARLAAHVQRPPQGGAEHDYVAWAKSVPGVTRAWAAGGRPGVGLVTVRFMMDETYENGLPQAGDVAAVQAVLDAERPLTALPVALSPIPLVIPVSIGGLQPSTPAVRQAVEAELRDLFKYGTALGRRLPISHVREAISRATGESDHVLLEPVGDILPADGEIPILGTLTWPV
ncbi:baseplate J/gp47 family protein [Lacibacterium aquatile]|uniref:Baseplate J/gp47 family protein n=1 Tax=Lacibacterium aquatile TaxID=1168082 RepID=A0ABW5DTG2_9PROT